MPQRILQINKLYFPWLGGVETVVQDIARALNQPPNRQVDVLACQVKGQRVVDTIEGVKVYRAASWGKLWGMPLSYDFFRLLKNIWSKYDLIILHHPFPLAFLALPFLPPKPLIIWYHSSIVRQKISRLPFMPFIHYGLRHAQVIIVSSQRLINCSPELQSVRPKCQVIHFGLDLEKYQINDSLISKAQSIHQYYAPDNKLVLSIGRLVYYKGFEYLIRAMANNPYYLLIIGQGPEQKHLQQLIDRLNLASRVKIIPPVPDTRPYYLASDLFVLPSSAPSEAFGLVQLEAMALGKPVINTDLPTGVPEVSIHQQTGLTVPIKNPMALNEAITAILEQPNLVQQYGMAARQRVAQEFNQRLFQQQLEALLSQIS